MLQEHMHSLQESRDVAMLKCCVHRTDFSVPVHLGNSGGSTAACRLNDLSYPSHASLLYSLLARGEYIIMPVNPLPWHPAG